MDEEAALAAGSGRWKHDGSWQLEGVEHEVVGPDEVAFTHPAYIDHITRYDPARVLAECEAKRRIVEEHRPGGKEGERYCGCCWLDDLEAWEPHPCPTMKAIALPYADHPDFREEWRP